jgi:ribonuclease R
VTIDGADARDFDDAVFAEHHNDGWHLIVAIADVAHYVKPGGALDKTAFERGNSTYFPDRVVPMLPEALSNELCSLKPHVERACIAAHLWLDKEGELIKWTFVRGVMKSHARLTYEQTQAAKDGRPDDTTRPLMNIVIAPLYGAFRCLLEARGKRGTLELDLPERKIEIAQGAVKAVKIHDRLDSHRLIEEFMITANVAAAAQLEGKGKALYRIHDRPTEMKLEGLRDFLDTLGISLVPDKQLHPKFLTRILENAAGTPHAQVVNEMMLRSQSQAVYSAENIGHFGLALAKYAHFTSPIRRYADLIVHRGLVRACKLGDDGLTEHEIENLDEIADHISTTERRSAAAEREAMDRFITLFMADRVGATFAARISGVARFGLFARLDETGADGIIPMNTLPDDYYIHDEKRQALIGRRTKRTYQLAQPVLVRLTQADRLTGSMALALVEDEKSPSTSSANNKKPKRRPRQNRH